MQFKDYKQSISKYWLAFAFSSKKNSSIHLCRHPEDVDLFVGINHESHVPNGLVGPVQACLIGFQFHNLKFGDRFFYRHEGQFTPGVF